MGATPAWATLALTVPGVDAEWLAQFSSGLLDLAAAHGVALVGGDTTRGPLTLSVQLMGHVPRGTALRRGGAAAGDLLAVTGTAPDAAAVRDLINRFEFPTPRVAFGVAAREVATAAIDISDGLVGDLPKLAQASGLAAHVDVERLPLSAALLTAVGAAATSQQARDWALAAGDDYELLLAVPAPRFAALEAVASRLNLKLTAVGQLMSGAGVTWSLNGADFVPALRGFDHFA
jgi:thiamine-monophosphate kinase